MRPRDREHVAVLEHVLRQPLRSRGVRHAAIEQRFDHRTAATQRIAHHHDVGIEIELLGAVPLDELDAQRRELIAHRRIDVQVRPVTRNPAALAIAAKPPMKVPAIPKMCTCMVKTSAAAAAPGPSTVTSSRR